MVELIAAAIITAGFLSSIVSQALTWDSAHWPVWPSARMMSTSAILAPSSTPFAAATKNWFDRVFISTA